jgi:hypothetical protein
MAMRVVGLLFLVLARPAAAQGPLLPFPEVVTGCWEDARLFESLRSGTLDYCRRHLRYVPGALDCYRVIDRVCTVFVPATGEWTEARAPRARIAFPCPRGPLPPVCRRLDLQ